VPTLDRAGLRANRGRDLECDKDKGHEDSSHRGVSLGLLDSSHRSLGAEKI